MITRRFFIAVCGLGVIFGFKSKPKTSYKPLFPDQYWGTYGKNREYSEPQWVQIDKCSNDHLECILKSQHQIEGHEVQYRIQHILQYRKKNNIYIEETII